MGIFKLRPRFRDGGPVRNANYKARLAVFVGFLVWLSIFMVAQTIRYPANRIYFADAETLQAKFNADALPNRYGISATGVGNETTLQALYNLKEFQAIPSQNFRNVLWFSSYGGADANAGTYDSPLQTLGKAADVCLPYTRCRFKKGEWWSPLVGTIEDHAGTTGIIEVGETISWDSGTSTGVAVDVDYGAARVVVRVSTGSAPEASTPDVLTGDLGGGTIRLSAVTDTLGTGWEDVFDMGDCGAAGELCLLLEGESAEDPPGIDCNDTGESGGANIGVFGIGAPSDVGVAAIQNFVIQYCPEDAVAQVNDVDVVALNVNCNNAHNPSGGNNNCFTTHNTGDLVVLNGMASGAQNNAGGSGRPVALTSSGAHTFVTQGEIHATGNTHGTGATGAVGLSNGATATFVGPYIHTTEAGSEAEDVISITSGGNDGSLVLCRVTVTDADNTSGSDAISYSEPTAGGSGTFQFFETSILNSQRGVLIDSLANGDYSLTARGLLIANMTICTLCDYSADVSFTSVDVEGLYQDGKFVIESPPQTGVTKATVDADTDGAAHWTLFDTNSNDIDGTYDPWDNSADTLALPQYAIHPDCGGTTGICYDEDITTYTCTLAKPIPSFVLGQQINSFTLTGKIGAR